MNQVHNSKDWHSQAPLQSPPSVDPLTSPKPSNNFTNYTPTSAYPEQHNIPYTNAGEPDTSRLPGMIAPSQPATPRPERAEAMYQPPFPRNTNVRGRTNLFANETGPFFSPSEPFENLYSSDKTSLLSVRVQSKMDRGFFMADDDWTCYRRNYFQVSSVFSIHGYNHYYAMNDAPQQVFVQTEDGLAPVQRFLLGVSARVANGEKEIELIQHTPKRDKGPQFRPDPKPITPGGNLTMSSVANNQNIVTFERVQFKTATANNGKRRAAQQYYLCVVDLFAETDRHQLVKVASCRSSPLVVRGRSPGHYAEISSQPIQQQQHTITVKNESMEGESGNQRQHVFATYSKPATPTPSSSSTEYSHSSSSQAPSSQQTVSNAYSTYYSSGGYPPHYAPTSNVQRSSTSPASQPPYAQPNYVIHDASHTETYPNEFHGGSPRSTVEEQPKMVQQFNMQQTGPIESPHSGFDWQRARYNSASSSASAPSPGNHGNASAAAAAAAAEHQQHHQQQQQQQQQAYFSQNDARASYSPTTPTYATSGRKYNNVPNLMNNQIA
ncbi:uncharacterized protein EV154DRAFT_493486 [Mucor mucedo]|uniref:uncharacterized protein n=1 Tax=Mucor mucedo TaxID=29922 RepID=UPI00221F77C0|nr:uncharacterized protein EV154DRAFT_493486 [Mucor mucedo]KAI7896097.1 hypothetical protein EV154DRAFT_493486 [Mucor mucedo]